MSFALIDGDVIAFRAAAAAQDNTDWGDGETGPTVNQAAAVANAIHMVEQWRRLSRCPSILVCLSPRRGTNFRKTLSADYKAGRSEKPLAYWQVYEALNERYRCMSIDGLEADDVMGIMSTSDKVQGVIVSIDKDMKTIPGMLLDPTKDARPRRITPFAANYFWMTQVITGDATDGYKGLPGAGPAAAEKILEGAATLDEMWHAVVEAYVEKGYEPEHALLQARLARILTRNDYDRDKETIRLWHPKGNGPVLHLTNLPSPRSSSASTPQPPEAASRKSRAPSRRKATSRSSSPAP